MGLEYWKWKNIFNHFVFMSDFYVFEFQEREIHRGNRGM